LNDGKKIPNSNRLEVVKAAPFLIAFLYYENAESAKNSLALNGEKLGENVIKVDLDLNSVEEKQNFSPKRTIFVGNLKYAVNDQILRDTFGCCGEIEYVRTLQCEKGCKGTAYVCFKSEDATGLAMELNGTLVLDREVHVERFHTKKLGAGARNKKEPLDGVARRIASKIKKTGNELPLKGLKKKIKQQSTEGSEKKKQKNYLGVKSGEKKKQLDKVKKSKKKKLNNLGVLAKKVAPRTEKQTKGTA